MADKIALFMPTLGSGGAERVTLNLAAGMAERGVTVDLVLASADGPLRKDVSPSVNVVDLGGKSSKGAVTALANYLSAAKPDALISGLTHGNLIAGRAVEQSRYAGKHIACLHSTLSREKTAKSVKHRLVVWMAKSFYRKAKHIVAVSKGVADDLASFLGIPASRIQVIYNPVISPELDEKSRAAIDHPWLKKKEMPVIVSVGTLRPEKDFPTLVHAFAIASKTRPLRLLILGDGPERVDIEDLVADLGLEDTVRLLGFLDNPFPYVRASDLYVLSSVREGLPGALIEALACGVPLVATDCPSGPAEVLQGGAFGRLVPMQNPEALAQAILDELSDPHKNPESSWTPYLQATAVDAFLELALGKAS